VVMSHRRRGMHKPKSQTAVGMLGFGDGREQVQAGFHDSAWYQCPTREEGLSVGRNDLSSNHVLALLPGRPKTGCRVGAQTTRGTRIRLCTSNGQPTEAALASELQTGPQCVQPHWRPGIAGKPAGSATSPPSEAST
jgi:hypothetical protein